MTSQHKKLLILGYGYLNTARKLSLDLFKDSSLLNSYNHHVYLSILCYRSSLSLYGLTPLEECESRLALGEVLYGFTTELSDAEFVISKGLSKASESDSLLPYLFRFYNLHIQLSVIRSSKFANSLLRRALREAERKGCKEWIYHFLLLSARLSSSINAINFLKQIVDLSFKNSDLEVFDIARIELARSYALVGDWSKVSQILHDVEASLGYVGGEGEQSSANILTGSRKYVLLYDLILRCVLAGRQLDAELAKDRLKEVHLIIDKMNDNYSESFKIDVKDAKESLVFATPSRTQMLNFGFVLSCAIHRDPIGSKPRALLFATQGVEFLKSSKLTYTTNQMTTIATDANSIRSVQHSIEQSTRIQIGLMSSLIQVQIMRRELDEAEENLNEMIKLCRSNEMILEWSTTLLLLRAFIDHAQSNIPKANEGYLAASLLSKPTEHTPWQLSLFHSNSDQNPKIYVQDSEMHIASSLAKFLLEISNDVTTLESFNHFIDTHIIQTDISPNIQAIIKLGQGILSSSTITKSKQSLTHSLTLVSKSHDNHLKALLLTFLSQVFINTHQNQALQMLETGFALSKKMGKVDNLTNKSFGNPILNLWYGKQLEMIYEKSPKYIQNYQKQTKLNEWNQYLVNKLFNDV